MPRTDAEQALLGVETLPTSINLHDYQFSAGMSTFQAKKAPSHPCQPLIFCLVSAAMPCTPKTCCGGSGEATHRVAFSIHLENWWMAQLLNFISAAGVPGGGSCLLPALGVCPDLSGEPRLPGSPTLPWLQLPTPSGGPGSRLGPVAVPDVQGARGHAPTTPHTAPG